MPSDPHPDLRPADASDSEDLLAWRNDPETRANSRSTGPVDAATHQTWLAHALADPNRRLWIAEAAGEKVGTHSVIRLEDGRAEFSITVAPNRRGRGIGVAMLRALLTDGLAELTVWSGEGDHIEHRCVATSQCLFNLKGREDLVAVVNELRAPANNALGGGRNEISSWKHIMHRRIGRGHRVTQ